MKLFQKIQVIRIILLIQFFIAVSSLTAQSNTYTWQEGDRQQTVYLNSNYIAEIQSPVGSNSEKIARIIPLKDTKIKSSLSKGFLPKSHANTHSEVFEESLGGRKMTLPGDIFIEFLEGWDEAKVKEWAVTQNLNLLGKLNSTRNIYRIQTSSGLESLHLANSLLSQTGIKSAFPNWLRESVRR